VTTALMRGVKAWVKWGRRRTRRRGKRRRGNGVGGARQFLRRRCRCIKARSLARMFYFISALCLSWII